MRSWKDNVRKVVPYIPGEQPKTGNVIKLNTNENPYPPSPAVKEAFKNFDYSLLRKYPDPRCEALIYALSEMYDVNPDQIFVGVGSDDVIAMSFMTFFCSSYPILFPDVSYSFYKVWADMMGIRYDCVAVNDKMQINAADYIGRQNGGIIFPNPNAPTANAIPASDVEKIVCANSHCVVIVDEAYIDFGGESAVPLIKKYNNLLVIQTFSKSRSLAGLRVGFAIGSKDLISFLWNVRNSFNSYTLNTLSVNAAIASLKDSYYFKKIINKVINTRERSKERLDKLGFEFVDSMTNFLFIKHPRIDAKALFKELYRNKIFVRYFDNKRTRDFLRVTIGTDTQMDVFFNFLENRLPNMEK